MKKTIYLSLVGGLLVCGAIGAGLYIYNQHHEEQKKQEQIIKQQLLEKQAQAEREKQVKIKQTIYQECRQMLLNTRIAYGVHGYACYMRWVVPNGRTVNQVCDCTYSAYKRNKNIDFSKTIYFCAMM